MYETIRTLMSGLVDYAGLFPPAGLGMEGAVRSYAAYRAGPYSWMLGRLVMPIARLAEFETAKGAVPTTGDGPWRLSALAGAEAAADREAIDRFNQRYRESAIIDSYETKADRPEAMESIGKRFASDLKVFVEIPVAADPAILIASIGAAGLRAKVRTGAVTAEGFPSTQHLARFIADCAAHNVPFKATAGLHHPLRNVYRLTYEPDSASGLMHGFLNVFLAAAFAFEKTPIDSLTDVLEEQSPSALQVAADGIRFRGRLVPASTLAQCRELVAISFGSCSFEEPVEDLKALGLL